VFTFLLLSVFSCQPLDDVHSRIRVDNSTDFADLESKGGVFKRLLHVSAPEKAQIASLSTRAAVRTLFGSVFKRNFALANASFPATKENDQKNGANPKKQRFRKQHL
jgi:hypothetical protein